MTSAFRRSILGMVLAGVALGLASHAAQGATLPGVTLPALALDPIPQPAFWTGLSVGTEVYAISRKHAKGLIGGGVDAAYDRAFANDVVLGVAAAAGYAPGFGGHGRLKGFDYAATDLKVGYAMGRLMPFATAGVMLDKAHFGPGSGWLGTESVNALLNGPGDLQATTRVGVGVDYAITNNLTLGVAVSAVNGRGPLVP